MTKILVLFNLRDGVDASEYENWARNVDLPTARALNSVSTFNVYSAQGLMGSDDAAPYQYAEWLEVSSLEDLGADAQSDAMLKVVESFQRYADNPQFIIMNDVG
jgi:hypothetical protein